VLHRLLSQATVSPTRLFFIVVSQFASLWFGSLTPFARDIYIGECEALLQSKVDAPGIELKPIAPSKLANVSAQAFHNMFVINCIRPCFLSSVSSLSN
jgi:hypothetical protein